MNTLTAFSDTIAGEAMQLLEAEMGCDAPISLLKDSQHMEFGDWMEEFMQNRTIFRNDDSLKSVSWVAGRIAQHWTDHPDVTTSACFEKLRANNHSEDWPMAGMVAITIMEEFAWDVPVVPGSRPLCVAPLTQIISAILPGLRFETVLQKHCKKHELFFDCGNSTTNHVYVEGASQVQMALDQLLVLPNYSRSQADHVGSSATHRHGSGGL